MKVIELKDGKICSCSLDKKIRIWDSIDCNYECIQTLKGHTKGITSIIEINNFIFSASFYNKDNNELKIWDESTYESIATIKGFQCCSLNALSKLNDNTLILGGNDVIYLVDIKTYQINKFQHRSLGKIECLYVNGNGLLFIGNSDGKILCYDSSSNQIIFKNKFHNDWIYCIIETEDNKLISCSYDHTINIYN